jgi:hypothetical protein
MVEEPLPSPAGRGKGQKAGVGWERTREPRPSEAIVVRMALHTPPKGKRIDGEPLLAAMAEPAPSSSSSLVGFFKKAKHLVEPPLEFDASLKPDKSLLENCKPHHRKAVELAFTDLYGRRHEALIRLPASWERALCQHVLHDPRDLELFLTFLQVTLWLSFSSAVQLLMLPRDEWIGLLWMAVHLPVTWIVLGQRFILAMHYAAHRPLIRPKLGLLATVLNAFPQTILSNFYGMPAGTYYVHHCVMHHQANNFFPYDLSSTMPYRRDSPIHFIAYVLNFLIHTMLYLPFYALRKKRFDIAFATMACCALYVYSFPIIYAYHPNFFLTSLGVSFLLGPFALMLGNYSQHIFVDPDNPKSNYGLACNHINAPFNMLTFNDGYHITHHVSSNTHWSEMPIHFIQHLDKYEQGGAILFQGINFDDVTFSVFAGEKGLRRLAKKVVQLTPEPRTESELVAMFRKRLQPVRSEADKLKAPQISVLLANEAFWIAAWYFGFPYAIFAALAVPLFHLIYMLA